MTQITKRNKKLF